MTTYYVKTGGSDGAAGTSLEAAFKTMQKAVNTAGSGDTIKVEPGAYSRFDIIGKSNLTIEANDPEDPPQYKTDYHNIAKSSDGCNLLTCAAIYIKNSDYITVDGWYVEDERAPAVGGDYASGTHYGLYLKNFRVENVWPSYKPASVSGKTRSPIWIQGYGGALKGLEIDSPVMIDNKCRSDDGRGTEIITLAGDIEYIYVHDGYWSNCQAINLNFLGVPRLSDNQPRHMAVHDCVFDGVYLFRVNNGVTTEASTMAIYFDRGTGPGEIKNCVVYNNDTRSMGIKLNWEVGEGNGMPQPCQRVTVRDCVFISGKWPAMMGQKVTADKDDWRPIESSVFAHNVLISVNGESDGSCFHTKNGYNLRLLNNVMLNFGTGNNDKLISAETGTGFHSSWTAAGNVIYTKADNDLRWGSKIYSESNWQSSIMDGTGSIGLPTFKNGLTTLNNTKDYSDYGIDTWVLESGRGYKDAEPITRANGSGSSSDSLVVDDTLPFFPGIPMLGVGGSEIVVGGSETTVIGVNYDSNTLSIDPPISWSNNAEVYYKPETSGVYSAGITSQTSTNVEKPTPPPPPEKLLSNPKFDSGTDGWLFSPDSDGEGSFTVNDGEGVVNISVAGSYPQLYQFPLSITSGDSLRFVMWAKSDNEQSVTINLRMHDSPYTNLGLNETYQLTDSCARYEADFTTTGTNSNVRFQMLINGDGTVTVSDFFLGESSGETGGCPEGGGGGGGGGDGETNEQKLTVSTSGDDWYHNNGSWFQSGETTMPVGHKDASRTDYVPMFRFQIDDTIPQTDVIKSAQLRIYRNGQDNGAAIDTIRVKAADDTNASAATTSAESKAITFGSEYVDWDMESATSEWKAIAGLKDVIQELLDLGQLTSGNSIILALSSPNAWDGSSNTMQYFRAIDYSAGEYAAELTIVSETPGGSEEVTDKKFGETFSETFGEVWS